MWIFSIFKGLFEKKNAIISECLEVDLISRTKYFKNVGAFSKFTEMTYFQVNFKLPKNDINIEVFVSVVRLPEEKSLQREQAWNG